MAASKIREAVYPGDVHQVFLTLDAVVRRLGMEVVYGNPQAGALRFNAGRSLGGWGEELDALVQPGGPGSVKVQIRSSIKLGLFDRGRNEKNLDRLFGELESHLAPPPGTPPPASDEGAGVLPPPTSLSTPASVPPSPVPPPAYGGPPLAPGWNPDPAGRHEERLWDGERWTPHVRDGDVVGVDPYDGTGIG